MVGTLRKNKKEIPPVFFNKTRPDRSTMFAFSEQGILALYLPKNKNVLIYSTMHDVEVKKQGNNTNRNYLSFIISQKGEWMC